MWGRYLYGLIGEEPLAQQTNIITRVISPEQEEAERQRQERRRYLEDAGIPDLGFLDAFAQRRDWEAFAPGGGTNRTEQNEVILIDNSNHSLEPNGSNEDYQP